MIANNENKEFKSEKELKELKRYAQDFNLKEFIEQVNELHEYVKINGEIKF